MDYLKVRSFIKDLTYDLDTVQYLLDYGRLKETLPIIEKILHHIDSLRASEPENSLNGIFPEDFWNKRLSANTSLSKMRASISKYSHEPFSLTEEDLDKIGYKAFVMNLLSWSEDNISKLQNETRSPLRKKIEKGISYLIGVIPGLCLVIILGWLFFTRDWGLQGSFYQGKHFEKYLYSGSKKTINFSASEKMDTRLPHDDFSALWKGDLLVPKDGKYTLTIKSDDGVRLFIDGQVLINQWQNGHHTGSKDIFLRKGPHLIILEYFQWRGGAVLKLFWAVDGAKKEIIPAKYLRH